VRKHADRYAARQWTWQRRPSDLTIRGFATDISPDRGDTVNFVNTPPSAYRPPFIGWLLPGQRRSLHYSVNLSAAPAAGAGLSGRNRRRIGHCGNWAVSASWSIPTTAVSGIYFVKLIRADAAAQATSCLSRDDTVSATVAQTSDTTWQAYNDYGGNSATVARQAAPRAARTKSANRLPHARPKGKLVFNAEYPMVRWLNQTGDVSYAVASTPITRRGRARAASCSCRSVTTSTGLPPRLQRGDRAWCRVNLASSAVTRSSENSLRKQHRCKWRRHRTLVSYRKPIQQPGPDPADPPT
jgi:hypothetical protein